MPQTATWYHCEVNPVSKKGGKNGTKGAVGAAAYITGLTLKDETANKWRYRGHPGEVLAWGSVAPKDAPAYLSDRNQISKAWNDVQRSETRINARVCRHGNFALSREFSAEDNRWVCQQTASRISERYQVLCTWAIHAPTPHGDERNQHGHFIFSERVIDHTGITTKKVRCLSASLDQAKAELIWQRKLVEDTVNKRLEFIGSNERITADSYKTRGIEREPSKHLGAKQHQAELNGMPTPTGDKNRAIHERNAEYDREIAAIVERCEAEIYDFMQRRGGRGVDITDHELNSQQIKETALLRELQAQKERTAEFEARVQASVDDAKRREREINEQNEARRTAGDIADPQLRYSQALGASAQGDSIATAIRAAAKEAELFARDRQDLQRQIASENDPQKLRSLELRRDIESAEYMAVTTDRIIGISRALSGRDTEDIVRDRANAREYWEEARELREERRDLQREVREQEMGQFHDKATQIIAEETTDVKAAKRAAIREHYDTAKEYDRNREQGVERGGGRSY